MSGDRSTGGSEAVASASQAPRGSLGRSGGAAIWVRYAVIGIALGGAWLWNKGLPPWQHALRLLVLVLVLVPAANHLRTRYLRRRGQQVQPSTHLRGLVIAKVILVVAALGAELLFDLWLPLATATTVVAALLAVAVVLAGPLAHEWIVSGGRRPGRAAPRDAADRG